MPLKQQIGIVISDKMHFSDTDTKSPMDSIGGFQSQLDWAAFESPI